MGPRLPIRPGEGPRRLLGRDPVGRVRGGEEYPMMVTLQFHQEERRFRHE